MALAEKTRLKGTKYDIGGFAIRNRYISKPNKARTVEAWSERITDDELGNLRTFDPKNLVDALMIMRPAVQQGLDYINAEMPGIYLVMWSGKEINERFTQDQAEQKLSRFAPDKVYNKPIGYKRNEVYQVTGSYYRASGKIPVVAFIVREGTGKVIILSKACLKPAKRAYQILAALETGWAQIALTCRNGSDGSNAVDQLKAVINFLIYYNTLAQATNRLRKVYSYPYVSNEGWRMRRMPQTRATSILMRLKKRLIEKGELPIPKNANAAYVANYIATNNKLVVDTVAKLNVAGLKRMENGAATSLQKMKARMNQGVQYLQQPDLGLGGARYNDRYKQLEDRMFDLDDGDTVLSELQQAYRERGEVGGLRQPQLPYTPVVQQAMQQELQQAQVQQVNQGLQQLQEMVVEQLQTSNKKTKAGKIADVPLTISNKSTPRITRTSAKVK